MNKKTEKIKYKLVDVLKRFEITEFGLSTEGVGITLTYTNYDAKAAWIMYVELLTRITTQKLEKDTGDEATALESVHKIFDITRNVLKDYGRLAPSFTKISIIILNKIIRPFTAKWHKLMIIGAFDDVEKCNQFRNELEKLRSNLVIYSGILAEMAHVDDLTFILD